MAKKTVKKGRPRWTAKEVNFMKKHYAGKSNAWIGEQLGRKVSSIVFKGYKLGLEKSPKRLKAMGKENIARRWK